MGWLWCSPLSILWALVALLGGARPKRLLQHGVIQFVAYNGLWASFFAGDFRAITLGAVSIFSPKWADDETTQKHEAIHTLQAFRLGMAFPFVYVAQWLYELTQTGWSTPKAYRAIALEVEAYSREND